MKKYKPASNKLFLIVMAVIAFSGAIIFGLTRTQSQPNTVALLTEDAGKGVVITQTPTQAKANTGATITNTKTGQRVKVTAKNEKDLTDRISNVSTAMMDTKGVATDKKLTDQDICKAEGGIWNGKANPAQCEKVTAPQPSTPIISSNAGNCKGGNSSVGSNQWAPTGFGLQADGKTICTSSANCPLRQCMKCEVKADGTADWGSKGICGTGEASNYVAPSYESIANGGSKKGSCWKDGTWYGSDVVTGGSDPVYCNNGSWQSQSDFVTAKNKELNCPSDRPYNVATNACGDAKQTVEVIFKQPTCNGGYTANNTVYTQCKKSDYGTLIKTVTQCFAPKVFKTSASGQVECVDPNAVISAACMTGAGNKAISVKTLKSGTKKYDTCDQTCDGSTGLCTSEINTKVGEKIGGDTNNAADCKYGVEGPGRTAMYACNTKPVAAVPGGLKDGNTTLDPSKCETGAANAEKISTGVGQEWYTCGGKQTTGASSGNNGNKQDGGQVVVDPRSCNSGYSEGTSKGLPGFYICNNSDGSQYNFTTPITETTQTGKKQAGEGCYWIFGITNCDTGLKCNYSLGGSTSSNWPGTYCSDANGKVPAYVPASTSKKQDGGQGVPDPSKCNNGGKGADLNPNWQAATATGDDTSAKYICKNSDGSSYSSVKNTNINSNTTTKQEIKSEYQMEKYAVTDTALCTKGMGTNNYKNYCRQTESDFSQFIDPKTNKLIDRMVCTSDADCASNYCKPNQALGFLWSISSRCATKI